MNQVAKKRFFENVAIIDIAEEGKGVGKSDDFVLFVDNAVPGDVADIVVAIVAAKIGRLAVALDELEPEHRRGEPHGLAEIVRPQTDIPNVVKVDHSRHHRSQGPAARPVARAPRKDVYILMSLAARVRPDGRPTLALRWGGALNAGVRA